jgi:hypothetical protein
VLAPCTLTGPSCDSQDTILDHVWLPTPRAGDRMLIGNAGAYTTCYSGRSAFISYRQSEVVHPNVRYARSFVLARRGSRTGASVSGAPEHASW